MHLFKYGGVRTLSKPFGVCMSLALPREQAFDAVVPAPLHWFRQWRRGYNQAELLAREVSRRTGVPLIRALRRRRATRTQAGLTGAKRRANVAGAFAVRQRAFVKGKRVLLVDDVLTTGATVNACAAALKRAGATYVAVLTLARTDRRGERLLVTPDLDLELAGVP